MDFYTENEKSHLGSRPERGEVGCKQRKRAKGGEFTVQKEREKMTSFEK